MPSAECPTSVAGRPMSIAVWPISASVNPSSTAVCPKSEAVRPPAMPLMNGSASVRPTSGWLAESSLPERTTGGAPMRCAGDASSSSVSIRRTFSTRLPTLLALANPPVSVTVAWADVPPRGVSAAGALAVAGGRPQQSCGARPMDESKCLKRVAWPALPSSSGGSGVGTSDGARLCGTGGGCCSGCRSGDWALHCCWWWLSSARLRRMSRSR